MKLKTVLSSLIIFFILGISTTVEAKKLNVNKSKSSVEWVGKKLTGDHSGIVKIKRGQLEFLMDDLVAGSFVIDMSTIENTDLSSDGSKRKIEKHLKSHDFFGVKEFPLAKMTITKVLKTSKGQYNIIADLEIKGKTKPIEFNASMHMNGIVYCFEAKILIDRTKYGIRYGSGSFFDNLGDKTINDLFELNISLMTE